MSTEIPPTVITRWAQLREKLAEDNYYPMRWFFPLVDAVVAGQVLPLYGLYPFTSHATLMLSRTTEYPFAIRGCPHVHALADGEYRVFGPRYRTAIGTHRFTDGTESKFRYGENEVLGEGGIEDTLRLLLGALPPDIGPAVDVIADELYRMEGVGLVEVRDRQLRKAVGEGKVEAVRDLLGAGAAVDAADEEGFTHLMIAILRGDAEIVRLLLAKGASILRENSGGETALSLGQFMDDKYPEILRLMDQAGQN